MAVHEKGETGGAERAVQPLINTVLKRFRNRNKAAALSHPLGYRRINYRKGVGLE